MFKNFTFRDHFEMKFTLLAHLLIPAFLKKTWKQMNKRAASGRWGNDEGVWQRELDRRVEEVVERFKS